MTDTAIERVEQLWVRYESRINEPGRVLAGAREITHKRLCSEYELWLGDKSATRAVKLREGIEVELIMLAGAQD